jgi:hypothetical protein
MFDCLVNGVRDRHTKRKDPYLMEVGLSSTVLGAAYNFGCASPQRVSVGTRRYYLGSRDWQR